MWRSRCSTRRLSPSRSAAVAEPIDYLLRRWTSFTRFLDDGRICLSNNAAERSLRGFALGRKAWLFAGSDRGADRAAAMATLIVTAKLKGLDPAGVAGRRARPYRRLPRAAPRCSATLELAAADH